MGREMKAHDPREIREEALTDALHPEFGYIWREPDGMAYVAIKNAQREVLQEVLNEIYKMISYQVLDGDWSISKQAVINMIERKLDND